MIRYCLLLLLSWALAACTHVPPPQIVTKEVKVAVPVPCDPKVKAPDAPLVRSMADLRAMMAKAPNVTEEARIVSAQLLLWMGYGPHLEAALDGCKGGT